MLKWILLLALSACGGFGQSVLSPTPAEDSSVSSEAKLNADIGLLFAEADLNASHIASSYWPESAGRYAGLLRQVSLDFPVAQVQGDFRTRLQSILIPWLEAQDHPEAQCVSVQQETPADTSSARFLLEIVCR